MNRRVVLSLATVFAALRCGSEGARPTLPAEIALSSDVAGFAANSGGANPAPVVVQITNTGEEPLTGLAIAVAYGSRPVVPKAGWATA